MPHTSIDVTIPLASAAAHEAVRAALAAVSERSRDGAVALTAVAKSGDEEVARIDVPVVVHSDAATAPPGAELLLDIRARAAESAFPTFEGAISIESLDSADSRLRLHGEYRVPLGMFGAVANALTLEGVAEDSLRRFLSQLATEALENVRKETEERYREVRRGAP